MPRSNDDENLEPTYTKPPLNRIDIDPKSARTVVHEIHTCHRRPAARENSQDLFVPVTRLPPNVDEHGIKPGILPRERRRSAINGEGQHQRRHYDTDSDSDSDSDYLSPHRYSSRHRRPSASNSSHSSPYKRRYSNELTRYDNRREVANPRAPIGSVGRRPLHESSDSDTGSYDSEADAHEQRKARNKKLIYTGLATVTTVAAANNVYQSTKGFRARRNAFKEKAITGELEDDEERKKHQKKMLMMDALGLLTVAVGVNNLRVGWARREDKRKAHEETEMKAWEKMNERRGGGNTRSRSRGYSVEER